MKTLQIKKELAITAHENANSKGKKLLEDLFGKKVFQVDIMDRINNFDDVLKELYIDKDDFDNSIKDLSIDERAYVTLKLIVSAYNEGREPDWTNEDEYKYYPWFYTKELLGGHASYGSTAGSAAAYVHHSSSYTYASVGSRLAFLNRDHAIDAAKKFTSIYKDWHVG